MKPLRVAIALIQRDGRTFLQRRDPAAGQLPGLWEFPGGKLKPREAPLDGLLRELSEELGWRPEDAVPWPSVRHAYPGRTVELFPFLCTGREAPRSPLAWGWFTPRALAALAVPEANGSLIAELLKISAKSMS